MKIFDWTILSLPLFEERHRALAAQLESWISQQHYLSREFTHLSASERGRQYVHILGQMGWLAHAVGAPDSNARPDMRSICLIREAFAYADDLLDFAFSIQSLATAPIAWYGSEVQRASILPDCRSGVRIGTLALSEPECASNLAAVNLKAVKNEQGYVLDGDKSWTSNGNIADFHCVLARTGEGPGPMGLSFLYVPSSSTGLTFEAVDLLAPRAFSSLRFEQCAVPTDALIGQAGMGFVYAMEILDFYRVTVGSAAIGFCRRACDAAVDWSKRRVVAGGSRLIETQMTMDKLANMAVYLDSASLLVARAAWEFDMGGADLSMHSSIAKLYATEQAQKVIDDTVQLFGSAGLVAGSVPEQLYRQIRALRIYEGPSEIQKMIIARAISKRNSNSNSNAFSV
jgi:acyl-CoA dehydrogenase